MRERVEDGWDIHRRGDTNLQWNASSSFCFRETGTEPLQGTESFRFLLASRLPQVSYKALNHLLSTYFTTFANLIKAISSRPSNWIILDSPRVSTFASLVSSATSKPWVVWCKASAQSGVLSSSYFAGLLRSLGLKSSLAYITSWTPTQSSWEHLPPTHCVWTHLLSSIPSSQLMWHFCLGNTCVVFNLGNRSIFCPKRVFQSIFSNIELTYEDSRFNLSKYI